MSKSMTASRILLVTLDSCRFDTASQAKMPFLAQLGVPIQAYAQGAFTLPAHNALFSGYPPRPCEPSPAISILPTLDRPNTDSTNAKKLEGWNVIEALQADGYFTAGFGGVRWFLHDQLRRGFSEFHYWGPEYPSDCQGLPEWGPNDFALNHIDEIVEVVTKGSPNGRWLCFVNVAQTHSPYMCDKSDALLQLQRSYSKFRNGKARILNDQAFLDLMAHLKAAQIQALESIDSQLQSLFESLEPPFDFIVCSDHGESLGEEGIWGHVYGSVPVMTIPLWTGTFDG
jgi:hypothetical protein